MEFVWRVLESSHGQYSENKTKGRQGAAKTTSHAPSALMAFDSWQGPSFPGLWSRNTCLPSLWEFFTKRQDVCVRLCQNGKNKQTKNPTVVLKVSSSNSTTWLLKETRFLLHFSFFENSLLLANSHSSFSSQLRICFLSWKHSFLCHVQVVLCSHRTNCT